ncbi:MAG: hypothetical protein K6B41_09460, partial [Butyrivibrio sp.]|nr:hypothetical protein [Butyrivibrio sp.]
LGSDTIITNGTKLTFYRTNGTDTVIFQREDGTYVGVTFELNSNYEPIINEQLAENLLDGIQYAG